MPKENANVTQFAVITSAAKSAAREEFRVKAYLTVTGTIYRLVQAFNKTIEALKKEADEVEKDVRVLEVEARDMSEDHPDKAEFVKEATEARVEADKRKTEISKEIDQATADHNKRKEELAKELTDIESGEKKQDYDEVLARANKLLKARVKELFLDGKFDTIAGA